MTINPGHSVGEEHPLTEFLEDPQAYVQRLRASRSPEVLTVAGEEQVVVQDAKAYRELLERGKDLEIARLLQDRVDAFKSGVTGVPASQVFARIRKALASGQTESEI